MLLSNIVGAQLYSVTGYARGLADLCQIFFAGLLVSVFHAALQEYGIDVSLLADTFVCVIIYIVMLLNVMSWSWVVGCPVLHDCY